MATVTAAVVKTYVAVTRVYTARMTFVYYNNSKQILLAGVILMHDKSRAPFLSSARV